jgi:epsilon-lactone hydrolase
VRFIASGRITLAAVACAGLILGPTASTIVGSEDACGRNDEELIATCGRPRFAYSSFLSEQVRSRLQYLANQSTSKQKEFETCGQPDANDPGRIDVIRDCQARVYYSADFYKKIRSRYPVSISTEYIGGVLVETFIPLSGVAPKNRERLLINLHGGGFESGSRSISQIESISIASVGRIKVVSIDYRMAPQYVFPAASEDVEAVYAELIRKYAPHNIGIFGCSAGGLLTAQVIARLQKRKLPLPGAAGMFCAGGSYWHEGDSGKFAYLWTDRPETLRNDFRVRYLQNVAADDPSAYPVRSVETLANFPPSLLITATRDLALSSVVHMHSLLVKQGVPAELHVWEGLSHGFFGDPDLPQSRDMYGITAQFFDRHLGRSGISSQPLQDRDGK